MKKGMIEREGRDGIKRKHAFVFSKESRELGLIYLIVFDRHGRKKMTMSLNLN